MSAIDLVRRAEIGREKRARTRERLLAAAAAALGRSDRETVSVDEIVAAAGVAKGTFYVHFEDVEALWAEVAERLTRDFDELLQSRRLTMQKPLERVAYGCAAFLEKGRREPGWAKMAARAAAKRPEFGAAARMRLLEDLGAALATFPTPALQPEIAAEMVAAVVLRVGPMLAEQIMTLVEATVAAILRAVGLETANAEAIAVKTANWARADIEAQGSGPARRL